MVRTLSVLGSTGSIGTQTLDVARKLGLNVAAVASHHNITLLEQQIREFSPRVAAVFDPQKAKELKANIRDLDVKVLSGIEGVCEIAALEEAELIVNAVVGMVGLRPTLSAIAAKKNIALANKETLVAGGALVMKEAQKQGVRILPVDSEHSAIFQCLQGCPEKKALKKLILTASGGPFFGKTREELQNVTPQQALRHPNWEMGAKITIDSASMMNKGLEIIEAAWLFSMDPVDIDVVVHRESIIHSMIEYKDNSVIAQLGLPDMRIPIQYAITYPHRFESPVGELDFKKLGALTFYEPDEENFLCLRACKEAIRRGGLAPAAANGANEEAVALFLRGELSFLQIGELVYAAMQNQPDREISKLEDILKADEEARRFVKAAAAHSNP